MSNAETNMLRRRIAKVLQNPNKHLNEIAQLMFFLIEWTGPAAGGA